MNVLAYRDIAVASTTLLSPDLRTVYVRNEAGLHAIEHTLHTF